MGELGQRVFLAFAGLCAAIIMGSVTTLIAYTIGYMILTGRTPGG